MAQCTPKSFDLTGKVALITGASYGIGMAIAKAMAANGATIVFNDIKQELVDKGLASYAEAGIKAHAVRRATSPMRMPSMQWWQRSLRKSATSTFWSTTPVSSSVSP